MPTEIAAPDPSALLVYGPLGAIAAVVFWFVLRYGPRLIEGHITFVTSCKNTQERLASNLETLTANHETSAKHHGKTHRALTHIANAGRESTTCPDTIKHLERAIDELQR